MSTKTVTARVPIDLYNQVQEMENQTGNTKTAIIVNFIKQGLNTGLQPETSSASEITEQIMKYKSRITALEDALKKCQSASNTPVLAHPLASQIEKDGISITLDGETQYQINSINQLLDVISKLEE